MNSQCNLKPPLKIEREKIREKREKLKRESEGVEGEGRWEGDVENPHNDPSKYWKSYPLVNNGWGT
eukprot:CAMPEP_0201542916 /NCGR_PEP_ID=MMETSP0161_2-20130828/72294_1 /ASSEMBLY_ACC=CAM_ASM_000251 /TAXON_ID=180227 /ORGANISM="Neoparamoeba aestuarina, Strain SoJaBio B1-5/56/2" /LENGTH=65 /DNA_ID=CAMNT_0047950609 /DNA_START=362 /DNA_END=559 /DNA_ORIENTATION=+